MWRAPVNVNVTRQERNVIKERLRPGEGTGQFQMHRRGGAGQSFLLLPAVTSTWGEFKFFWERYRKGQMQT